MKSMREMLTTLSCNNLFECVFGLNSVDTKVYMTLCDLESGRVDEISKILDKGENTVYKSLQKLVMAGLVYREKVVFEGGGYCFIYRPVPLRDVMKEVLRIVDEFCVRVREVVEEFAGEFRDDSGPRLSGLRNV